MVRLRRLKKYAPHLIIMAVLTASVVPTLGFHLLDELEPTLNLVDVLSKPEAVNLEGMEIVDKSYEDDITEYVHSISNNEIDVRFPIWDIEGIYHQDQYGLRGATNYFTPSVLIHEEQIDLSLAPLPNHTYTNEPRSSVFGVYHNDTIVLNQDVDDAWNRNTDPYVNYTSETLLLGGHQNYGNANQRRVILRWELPIPQDSVIIESYVNLTYHSEASFNGFTSRFYAFDESSTANFSNINENIRSTRPLYAGSTAVNWAFAAGIGANETLRSPDITELLQHVINRDDWEENNGFGVSLRPTFQVGASVEFLEFWSYNGSLTVGKPEYTPKLYVRYARPESTYPKGHPQVNQWIYTKYDILEVLGVWNTSNHVHGNLYNESEGDTFGSLNFVSKENWIILNEPAYQNETSLWVTYTSVKIPVVVEYTIRDWTTVTWLLALEFDNRGDNPIAVPRANLTLNYLDGNLGEGWIAREYEIKPHSKKMVDAYLVMENDRITDTFVTAVLTGEPIEFKLGFEAYILTEDQNDNPLLPIIYSIDLDFPFPSASRGPPPFIHSITRDPVEANQPVKISVLADDEGSGISNRTYIYYSIDKGSTWEQVTMTGGIWWNNYLGEALADFFPIKSTIEPEIFEGWIPGLPAGTEVLFKVYLEDYADNIDHEKKGNWMESQIYSYVVPVSGVLSEFTQEFEPDTSIPFFTKFLNFIELNGLVLSNFLFSRGITSDALVPKLPAMAEFFYDNDIDSNYAIAMLLVHFDKGVDVMGDSGVSVGYVLNLFGIEYHDIFTFLVDHAFLPVEEQIYPIAKQRYEEITILDDLDGFILDYWNSTPSGIVAEEGANILDLNGNIGSKSLEWTISGPSILSGNLSANSTDLSKNDDLVFYIDYSNHTRINGNLSIILEDNNGKKMTSNNLTFVEVPSGTFQEIRLNLKSEFMKETGFNIGNITYINFTYSGNEAVNVYIDYISAYSSLTYAIHNYFTNTIKLRNTGGEGSIKYFLDNIFQGMGASLNPLALSKDYIMPDWVQNNQRTGSWNFLNLMATNATYDYIDGPAPNHHMVGAELLLEYVGVPDPYKKICELLGIEIEEPDKAFTKAEIYPYTQNLGILMVYIPLGAVVALAIVLRARNYRYKRLNEKIGKLPKKDGDKKEVVK